MPDSPPFRTLQNIPQSSSADCGQTIQLDLEFADGQRQILRMPFERAPRLVHAIVQASAIAEKQRKLQPGEPLETVSAYIVQDCQVLTSNDNRTIGIQFVTGSGFPVHVAMSKEIALKIAGQIDQQLDQLGTRPPRKPS